MVVYEWVVCKGCGKTGWLDIDQPAGQTEWRSKSMLDDDNDERRFFLCIDCDCYNCPSAYVFTRYDMETGDPFPDYDCTEGKCVHLSRGTKEVD